MTKTRGIALLIATAGLAWASVAPAETHRASSSATSRKDVDESTAPAATTRTKDAAVAKTTADSAKGNAPMPSPRQSVADPYAVPLFKDARQLH